MKFETPPPINPIDQLKIIGHLRSTASTAG